MDTEKKAWSCPQCGEWVRGQFCSKCGAKRPPDAELPEPEKSGSQKTLLIVLLGLSVIIIALLLVLLLRPAGNAAEAPDVPAAAPAAEIVAAPVSPWLAATEAGQYYESNAAGTETFTTVQFSMDSDLAGAEAKRDALAAMGYDAFVYKLASGGGYDYRVMSSKFIPGENDAANLYLEEICALPGYDVAYMTKAELPESAEADFRAACPAVSDPGPWVESPTGEFYKSDAAGTSQALTVQFSASSSFRAAEGERDKLLGLGCHAFVYKLYKDGGYTYRIMSALFRPNDRGEAEWYLEQFKELDGCSGAYLSTVNVPESAIADFEDWYY